MLSLASLAEGAMTVTDRGTGSVNSSESFTVMSTTAGNTIAVGSTGVLTFAATNAAGNASNTPTSITDSAGNVWLREGNTFTNSGANVGTEIAIYIAHKVTTAVTPSTTLTLTYTVGNVTAKCWTFIGVAPAAGNIAMWNGYSGIASTSAAPTRSFGGGANAGVVVIGMCGAKSGDTFTGDSDALDGSWSAQQHTAASTGMSVTSQWKVITGVASNQSYDVTLTSANVAIGIINMTEVAANNRGLTGGASATTTFTTGPTLTISSGSLGVVCVAMDNAGLNGAAVAADQGPITDTKGNVWTLRNDAFYDNGAASSGAEMAIYTSPITTNLVPGDTLTFTWAGGVSVGSKTFHWYEFSTPGFTYSYSSGGNAAGATTATPTVTTSSITNGDTVIGLGSAEGADTWAADADSSNGSWSQMATSTAGATGLAAIAGITQYKTVTGTAAQTFNPTLTSADTIIGWISIHPTSSQSATNGFLQW